MKTEKNQTLFRMIMGRVFVMLGIIVALTAAMLIAMITVEDAENMWHRVDRFIAEAQPNLKAARYQALSDSKWLKKQDTFDVVDMSGHVLYSSSGRTRKYGKVYLSYIQPYDKDANYTLFQIQNKGYLLLYGNQDAIQEATVLDRSRNVQYTTAGRSAAKLSKKTMKLLSDNTDTLFQKYAFTTSKGEKRYLLLHLDGSALYDQTQRDIQRTAILIGYGLGIILIFVGVKMLLAMERKVSPRLCTPSFPFLLPRNSRCWIRKRPIRTMINPATMIAAAMASRVSSTGS